METDNSNMIPFLGMQLQYTELRPHIKTLSVRKTSEHNCGMKMSKRLYYDWFLCFTCFKQNFTN